MITAEKSFAMLGEILVLREENERLREIIVSLTSEGVVSLVDDGREYVSVEIMPYNMAESLTVAATDE